MKVKLQVKPEKDVNPRCRSIQWKKSLPFFVNPRGVLIHRVKRVTTIIWDGKVSHHTAHYWCNNMGRGEFFEDPPKERLLCTVCESNAVAHGEKTADELAGRHVCLGKMKAHRICCKNEEN